MPIVHTVDRENGRLSAVATGGVTLADILHHLNEERLAAGLGFAEIIDGTTGTVAFSPDDLRKLVEVMRDLGTRQSLGPTAVIVSTDYAYGMMRLLEMLVDDVCKVRPFRDLADAERWLQDPNDTP